MLVMIPARCIQDNNFDAGAFDIHFIEDHFDTITVEANVSLGRQISSIYGYQ